MDRRGPSLIFRLMAMLLFAMIGLQAAPSGAETFQQQQGSAFSASTIEVALAPSARNDASYAKHLQPLTLPPPRVAGISISSGFVASHAAPTRRPDSTGPPRDDAWYVPRTPRPPPAS